MTEGLADLELLSRMALDRDLARLKVLAETVRERRSDVEKLTRAKAESSGAMAGLDPVEAFAGPVARDHLWRDWLRGEHLRRQSELARAMADLEAQRMVARVAFGRAETLRQLREADLLERRQAALRRGRNSAGIG